MMNAIDRLIRVLFQPCPYASLVLGRVSSRPYYSMPTKPLQRVNVNFQLIVMFGNYIELVYKVMISS